MKEALLSAAGILAMICALLFIRSCESRDERIADNAKMELTVESQGKALESHERQAGKNNEAGIWLKNAEQTEKEVTRVYTQEVDNAKIEEFDLDVPLPADLVAGGRVRVTEAQSRICAGSRDPSNSACASATQKDTAHAQSADRQVSVQVGNR